MTKEGSSHKGKGKSRADRQKSSCSGCGQHHMIKECWFKGTNKVDTTKDCRFKNMSRSKPRNNKQKKGKGKGKGKGKNSVDKVNTLEKAKRAEKAERAERAEIVDGNTCRRYDHLYKSDLANYPE